MASRFREEAMKVVLLGNTSVGKTAILTRYTQDNFIDSTLPTVGVSFITKRLLQSDGSVLKLEIWDTAGQERFRSLIPMYYKDASVALVVYDVTTPSTLEGAKHWIQELKRHLGPEVIIGLAGNKTDLKTDHYVSAAEVKQYADLHELLQFEMSAKTGENVNEAFADIAREAHKVHVTPRSSLDLKDSQQVSVRHCCW